MATFRRQGDMRTIVFAGAAASMRDLTGLRYIQRLLAHPGREFHVLDLTVVDQGTVMASPGDDGISAVEGVGSGLPVIDDQAREAYRRRLAEIEEDIEEATRLNDIGRLELARRDRGYLVAELTRAFGLGGRRRHTGASAERARTSVARASRYALRRLAERHSAAAAHFDRSISTGTYCVYRPDPLATVEWTTS